MRRWQKIRLKGHIWYIPPADCRAGVPEHSFAWRVDRWKPDGLTKYIMIEWVIWNLMFHQKEGSFPGRKSGWSKSWKFGMHGTADVLIQMLVGFVANWLDFQIFFLILVFAKFQNFQMMYIGYHTALHWQLPDHIVNQSFCLSIIAIVKNAWVSLIPLNFWNLVFILCFHKIRLRFHSWCVSVTAVKVRLDLHPDSSCGVEKMLNALLSTLKWRKSRVTNR